jgi:hypothetical protein
LVTTEEASVARASVDPKSEARAGFGNDGVGFIRVRRRTLTPYWEHSATASASYDIVKAVRVGGKPRHRFVLGLGSLKNVERGRTHFWNRAVGSMVRHGLSEEQRRYFLAAMVRKGARLPTREEYEQHLEVWPHWSDIREIEGLIPTRRRPKRKGRPARAKVEAKRAKRRPPGPTKSLPREATPVRTPVKEQRAALKAMAKAVAEAKAKNPHPPIKVKKGPMLADNARYAPGAKLDWYQPNKRIPVERAYGMVPMSPSTPTEYRHIRRTKNGDVVEGLVRYERDADCSNTASTSNTTRAVSRCGTTAREDICSDSGILGRGETLADAKAMAQAHFERRLAGLEVAPTEACSTVE